MANTKTAARTLQQVLIESNPTEIADALKVLGLGNTYRRIKATIASLGATATPDITSAAVFAAATIDATSPAGLTALPKILVPISLRISASGTAASLGTYIFSDAGGTALIPPGGASAAVGVALLGDDRKTITFPNTVTGFVIEYIGEGPGDVLANFEKASTQ
jgi:hypothetical protein